MENMYFSIISELAQAFFLLETGWFYLYTSINGEWHLWLPYFEDHCMRITRPECSSEDLPNMRESLG